MSFWYHINPGGDAITNGVHSVKTKPANLANAAGPVEKMGEAITNEILAIIESGTDEAQKLWRNKLAHWTNHHSPYNADNGRPYTGGGNILALMIAADSRGFTSNGWITFGNMTKRGFSIKKGCKNPWVWVLSPRMAFDKKDKDGNVILNPDGTNAKAIGPQRAYKVFNMDCVDTHGKPVPGARQRAEIVPDAQPDYTETDALLAHHNPTLSHGGNRAFYRPGADSITMPLRSQFTNAASYYHVLLHELTHWTGHKSRLDRDQTGNAGGAAYAYEELIAELGSAFVMARLGIPMDTLAGHANYLKYWAAAMRKDHTIIMKAATAAIRACKFLTDPVTVDVPDAEEPQAEAA